MMKRLLQLAVALGLLAAVVVVFRGSAAHGQGSGPPRPPAADGKAPVQGYTRLNKHTGQPEQVRPHKRRPPAPQPVPVQSYTRQGRPVAGHQRQPPGKPSVSPTPPGGKKAQGSLPRPDAARRRLV